MFPETEKSMRKGAYTREKMEKDCGSCTRGSHVVQ